LTKRGVSKIVPFNLLRTMKLRLDRVDPKFLQIPTGYVGRMLESSELAPWSGDPRYELDEAFLASATKRGDRCYAITFGDELASYGWYSKHPTRIADGLDLHFDPSWVYMFKGFTLPAHRGKRLHALGMARALEVYVKEGSRGIVSYVESNNFASLKSCYRMGYEDIGTIFVSTVRGRLMTTASRGCKSYGLRVRATG
ncbi:MAG: family acetyltransferase, partial [Labilithrix sp.]|nr:family acetyltransferase [Labilithrix sp.]